MNLTKVKLSDICIGKGCYGIPASAVPFSDELYTYLRITDINDDGTLNLADKKSVDDPKAKKYILKENDKIDSGGFIYEHFQFYIINFNVRTDDCIKHNRFFYSGNSPRSKNRRRTSCNG